MSQRSASFADFNRRALAGESLSVVFLGGSLSWGANASDPQRTSFRGRTVEYLRQRYPNTPFAFHDATLGGVGSKLALFRLERDVYARHPDLVFLDFAANDDLFGHDMVPLVIHETLLREMISRGIAVLQCFFGYKFNFGPQWDPQIPPRIRSHRALAAAYKTAVGDTYPYIQGLIESGAVSRDKLWPFDGAHPDDEGYRLFFEAVRDGFETAVAEGRHCFVPEHPVYGLYHHRRRNKLSAHRLPQGWSVVPTYRTALWFDGQSSRWMDDVVMCDASGSDPIEPLAVDFEGSFVSVFGEGNHHGLSFRFTIDGQPPAKRGDLPALDIIKFDTSSMGTGNLFMYRVLAEDLTPGRHHLEITPVIPTGLKIGQLRIESVCSAG